MNDHEQSHAQFLPEIVDEQIDKLVWSHRQKKASMAPDERLISDLHALYTAHAATRERVWKRLAKRIASNDAITTPLVAENEKSAREHNRSFERYHPMKHEISPPRRTHMQRLGLIAAVVFAALIVGSMAWVFTLARQHNGGSGVAAQPQAASQQNQPSYSGIYVNSEKSLARVDPQTGKVTWHYDLPSIPTSYDKNRNAVFVAKFMYVGGAVYALVESSSSQYKTSIVALNAENGQELWSQPLAGGGLSDNMDMVVADNMIYIGTQSVQGNTATYSVYSFATADGKRGMTYPVPAYIFALTSLKGMLYVATQDGLYAFDLTNHQQRWHTALKTETAQQSLVVTRPSVVNGILYAAVVSDNEAGATVSRVAAFSADSGKQLWQSDPVDGQVFDLTLSDGVVYFGSTIPQSGPFKGALYAYNAENGQQLWSQQTNGAVQWAPSVSNGVVYASAYVGIKQSENVLAVSASNGKQLWQHQIIAGLMTTPYEQNGMVYVAGGFNNGKLYGLKAGSGEELWTLDLTGEPQAITVVA